MEAAPPPLPPCEGNERTNAAVTNEPRCRCRCRRARGQREGACRFAQATNRSSRQQQYIQYSQNNSITNTATTTTSHMPTTQDTHSRKRTERDLERGHILRHPRLAPLRQGPDQRTVGHVRAEDPTRQRSQSRLGTRRKEEKKKTGNATNGGNRCLCEMKPSERHQNLKNNKSVWTD